MNNKDFFIAVCTFDNGDTIENAYKNGITRKEVGKYYFDNIFNLGSNTDDLHRCVRVEFFDYE